MNPRYAKQPNGYGCGPTALLNVLKWAGQRVTLKAHYRFLETLCKTHDLDDPAWHGTAAKDFDTAIDCMSRINETFKVQYKPTITRKRIRRHLQAGGAVVLLHCNELGTHYTLLIGIAKGSPERRPVYITVNGFHDMPAVHGITHGGLMNWMRHTDHNSPQAWLINRYTVSNDSHAQTHHQKQKTRKDQHGRKH